MANKKKHQIDHTGLIYVLIDLQDVLQVQAYYDPYDVSSYLPLSFTSLLTIRGI